MFDYLINPLMTLILRSPLHGLVSKRLLLLTFTGRKSGRQFTTPVGYIREDDTLYVLTESPWWKNMRDGTPVMVRLQGETLSGYAEAKADPETAAHIVRLQIQAGGAEFAERRFGIQLTSDDPEVKEIIDAVRNTKVIIIDLHRE